MTSLHNAKGVMTMLVLLLGACFHPDDPMADYIDQDNKPVFDPATAMLLQAMLNDAMYAFEIADQDPYEYCMSELKRMGMAPWLDDMPA